METGTSVDEALAASRAFAGRATWGAGGEGGEGRSGGRHEGDRESGGGAPRGEDGGGGGRGGTSLGGATWGARRFGEDARREDDVGESERAAAAAAKPKPVIKVLRRKPVEETGASAERAVDAVSSGWSTAPAPPPPQTTTTTTTTTTTARARVREDKPVDRERIVDTPGSDLLQSRGATAPVVLRRKPESTPAAKQAEEIVEPTSDEDPDKKARKQRGGRRVREREQRRVERVQMRAHHEAVEDGSGLQNVPQPVDSNWVNAYPEYPYMAPNAYAMAFSDANALFHTFAPNYQGHAGQVPSTYYGYAAVPNPYAQQAPVMVPADAPTDIKATGTYGGKTSAKKKNAVKRLTKKLADLPSSLGAEFGSTDDLSSFAELAKDDKSAQTTTTTTTTTNPQKKRQQWRRPGGRHAKSRTKSTSQPNNA